jgi:6-pyruvoyltetrahydropterin/6-carboxytetrahydropterin synthase
MSVALPLPAPADPTGSPTVETSAGALEVELSREYRFEAAHHLPKVPVGHRCSRLHGHSYRIEIFVRGLVDEESGWLIDFYDLDRAVQPLVDALDHRLLNEIEGLQNPTCEHLCSWIWRRLAPVLPQLDAVTIWETNDSRCTYRGPRPGQGVGGAGSVHGR